MTSQPVPIRAVLIGCFTAVLCSGCTTTVRQHPDFAQRRSQLSSVAVVPPVVEVTAVMFKGDNHPLQEEATRIEERLPSLLAAALEKHGFAVKEAGLDEDHYVQKPDLRFQTTQLQGAFARADAQMFKVAEMSTSDAQKYRDTLGTEVLPISDHAGVDAVVIAKMSGFKKSSGEIAKDVVVSVLIAAATLGSAVPIQPTQYASLHVALVDGTTGEILWANVAGTTGDFEDSGLTTLVDQIFKPFPK